MSKTVNNDSLFMSRVGLRMVAFTQILMCLAGLVIIPFAFNYGGAAAHPDRFMVSVAYVLSGLVIAIFVLVGSFPARILALVWHSVFVCGVVWAAAQPKIILPKGLLVVAIDSAVFAAYLAATSLPELFTATKRNPKITGTVLLVSAAIVLLIVVREAFLYSTDSGLEMRLLSNDTETFCEAAKEYASKGTAAQNVLPTLEAKMGTASCPEAPLAKYIEHIGGVEALANVVETGSHEGRLEAVLQLRVSAEQHHGNEDVLKSVFASGLKDEDSAIRRASVEGLGELGEQATDVLPKLETLVEDPDPWVRGGVPYAIAKIKNAGRPYAIDESQQASH